MTAILKPARLRAADALRVGGAGLRARPTRVILSALGIAIGIAAMVSVVGISTSGSAQLDRELDKLGTNLLQVAPGVDGSGREGSLPDEAPAMIGRIAPVTEVASIGKVAGKVYRSDLIDPGITGGIGIYAASLELPRTLSATLATGTWLNKATVNYPVAVLAHRTALMLGIKHAGPDVRVLVGGQWFTVAGILNPMPLAESLDSAVFIGWQAAQKVLGFDGHPTMIFTRSVDSQVHQVRDVLAYTANPAAPSEVKVSRPSDALAARAAADQTFTALLLGLGAVALLVGGIGVANTMVISVLERRGEIGLRRSLGATRGHIRLQFLTESLLLSAVGGFAGVVLGVAATATYAQLREWPTLVPLVASGAGFGATLVVGVVAGLYPAARAARLSPTEALATS